MLPLHPSHLEAVYDCLRRFPPFKHWQSPPAEEVHFAVTQAKDRIGSYCFKENGHHITGSSDKVGHFDTLARLVAHEMIHLAQEVAGVSSPSQHNTDFKRRAALVARYHGFDPKEL